MRHRIQKVAQAQQNFSDDEFEESGSDIYSKEDQESGAEESSDFVDSDSEEELRNRNQKRTVSPRKQLKKGPSLKLRGQNPNARPHIHVSDSDSSESLEKENLELFSYDK